MIAAAPLAVGALSSIFGSQTATAPAATSSIAGSADSFSSLLASFSSDTVGKLQSAEAASISGIQGKATTQSVVEAVMSAQEQLQTALAVRDKAVNAFQDISRMPI